MPYGSHRLWFGFGYNGNSKASSNFSWNTIGSTARAPPKLLLPPRGLSLVHLAICYTHFPMAPVKQQQVACCKQAEPIVQKKQGLWQSFCWAEEADFTMQMAIAAIFKQKLLTSLGKVKTDRRKQLIYDFPL